MRITRQSRTIYLLLICTFLFSLGCSPTRIVEERSARELSSSDDITSISDDLDAVYQIRPGDEIEVLVWEHENFDVQTTVARNGTITMPLIGEVDVSGLTQEQLERELTTRLSEYISGDINLAISIRNTDNMLVSVLGMVQRPDNYPILDQTSLFKILSTAGGPSDEANIRSVRIYRKNGNPNHESIDLTQYLDDGQMNSSTILVNPGDIVYVPRRQNAIREMSDFLRDAVMLFGIFRVFN